MTTELLSPKEAVPSFPDKTPQKKRRTYISKRKKSSYRSPAYSLVQGGLIFFPERI